MESEATSHDKREMKKEVKEQERQQTLNEKNKKEFNKNIMKYAIVAVVILVIVFGLYKVVYNIKSFQPYYDKPFHWHSNINMFICGQEVQLKCGSSMCGTVINHHHNDQIMHQEGNVLAKKEDLALARFFDTIGIKFSDTEIADKKNGDLCNGKPGNVNLYVNGKLNNEFSNYVPTRCDAQNPAEIRQRCDKIEVKFE